MIASLAMFGILAPLFGLFFFCLIALAFVFWIWMLVDCIQNNGLDSTQKILWALVIFFLHGLGALIYFLVGRQKA